MKTIKTENLNLIPTPTAKLSKNWDIDENQSLGVRLALTAYSEGKAGFLNADGTGVGKTRQILVTAAEMERITGKPSLVITENENIITNAFVPEANALGIDLDALEIGTYAGVSRKKYGQGDYGLVAFDEAHNLKNPDSGKSTACENIDADYYLYATATPMDKMINAVYFIRQVTGLTEDQVTERLGIIIKEEIAPEGHPFEGQMILRVMFRKGVSYDIYIENLKKVRMDLVKEGKFIRRTYPFQGVINEIHLNNPGDVDQKEMEIEMYYEAKKAEMIAEGIWGRGSGLAIGGQKRQDNTKMSERAKSTLMTAPILRDLKNGKKVIIVAESVHTLNIKSLDIKETGICRQLTERFESMGYKVAQVYGGDKAMKAYSVQKFQNGTADILIMTAKSGATGISLDDTTGDSPRVMYMLTANYSGDLFEQIKGRVSRRNTKSEAEINICYLNTDSDIARQDILRKKLNTLNAINKG